MEEWQLAHIERNLRILSENIFVNQELLANLLAANVLNYEEREIILSKATESSRVFELLRCLRSRTSYSLLVKALQKGHQSMAAEILTNHPEFQDDCNITNSQVEHVKKQRAEPANLMVGDPDCTIERIIRVVSRNDSSYMLLKSWQGLSHSLDLPRSFIHRMESRARVEVRGELDILHDVLREWRSQKSNQATLDAFLCALEDNQLRLISDVLRDEFVCSK